MQELRGPDGGVGYWQGVPLSAGRVLEDALALTWRLRRFIAPVVVLQMLVMGFYGVLLSSYIQPIVPVPANVSAVHSMLPVYPILPPQFFLEAMLFTFLNFFFVVALIKVLYAGYYEHISLRPSDATGFALGFVRMLFAKFCFILIVALGCFALLIVPVAILGFIDYELAVNFGTKAPISLCADGISILLFVVFIVVYILFATVGDFYVTVGSIIRTDNIFRVVRESLRFVLAPKHFKRLLKLGAMGAGLAIALAIVVKLFTLLISSMVNAAVSGFIQGALETLITTPLTMAFGVVLYIDAHFRLLSDDAPSQAELPSVF